MQTDSNSLQCYSEVVEYHQEKVKALRETIVIYDIQNHEVNEQRKVWETVENVERKQYTTGNKT